MPLFFDTRKESMANMKLKESWKGFLSFSFVSDGNKTVVKDKKHFGPLVLQRPYYEEENRPSVLVIHPPGGVVGGDELELQVNFQLGAKGMVGTPAATKFYRSNGCQAIQCQTISMVRESEVEWLPQETLCFNQSIVNNTIRFVLADADNKFIAWDIVGLGRPVSGEGFEEGVLQQSLEVWIAGRLVFMDRIQITPQGNLLKSSSALSGHSLFATALFYQKDERAQRELVDTLQASDWSLPVGVTCIDSIVVMRVLATELDEVKKVLFDAWSIARPAVLGIPAIKLRIWNT